MAASKDRDTGRLVGKDGEESEVAPHKVPKFSSTRQKEGEAGKMPIPAGVRATARFILCFWTSGQSHEKIHSGHTMQCAVILLQQLQEADTERSGLECADGMLGQGGCIWRCNVETSVGKQTTEGSVVPKGSLNPDP